jgi:hypothetical protein
VLLVDKGKNVAGRKLDNPLTLHPAGWETHDLVSGAGGAGLYSDGKLTLTFNAGGKLHGVFSGEIAQSYLSYIETKLLSYDGVSVRSSDAAAAAAGEKTAQGCGLEYKYLPIRHFGSTALKQVVSRFFADLEARDTFEARFQVRAKTITTHRGRFWVELQDSQGQFERVRAGRVIVAVGKEGSWWLNEQIHNLGITSTKNRLYFGVRVETEGGAGSLQTSLDPKFSMHFSDGTKIKTHCFCRRGQVLELRYFGMPLAGSHTPFTEKQANARDDNGGSVFGVLLSDTIENPISFDGALQMMRDVSTMTRGNLLVQRFEDFVADRPTRQEALATNPIRPPVSAVPGSVSGLRLPLDYNTKFLEFVHRLSQAEDRLVTPDSLIYAPAIEWWTPRIQTSDALETSVENMYVAGDGAGVCQGITYAAATGLLVADDILSRS